MSVLGLIRKRSLLTPQNKRLVRYLIVGTFGFAVNQAVFIIMYSGIGIPYVVAGILGSGVSIFGNYVLNDSWTWKDNGATGVLQWIWRGGKYGATRVVGVGIGTIAQIIFVEIFLIEPVISNVLKVGVGVLWGFGASEKWVWNSDKSSDTDSA